MARTKFAAVLAVIIKIAIRHDTVFVANQFPLRHHARVELHLKLDILRDRLKHRVGFAQHHSSRLLQRIEIHVVAVPRVGERLQSRIIQVAATHAEDRQEHAGVTLTFDQADQRVLTRDPDIEVAVGGEHHTVDSARDELLPGDSIGGDDALCAVGGAAGIQ